MAALIAFVTANSGLILSLAVALLSVLTAIFNKNERAVGIFAFLRGLIERFSALQPRNSVGTLKVPGTKAGPVAVMAERE